MNRLLRDWPLSTGILAFESIPSVQFLPTLICRFSIILFLPSVHLSSYQQLIETNSAQSFMGVDDTPENRAKFEASFPCNKALKTGTSLSYVANAAVYLCSDEAAFVSGVNLPIDGAATVHAPGGMLYTIGYR